MYMCYVYLPKFLQTIIAHLRYKISEKFCHELLKIRV